MSVEAIEKVTLEEARTNAEAQARQMMAQAEAQAAQQTQQVLDQAAQECQTMKQAARSHLEQADELIVEKVVNG